MQQGSFLIKRGETKGDNMILEKWSSKEYVFLLKEGHISLRKIPLLKYWLPSADESGHWEEKILLQY